LRAEIAAAHPGDTINFAPSLDNQTIKLGSQLSINKNLNIQGPGAGLLAIRPQTVNSAFVPPRILSVAANTQVTISGLTLEDGGGTAHGYWINVNGESSPSAYDHEGGAILNFGTLTVSGCTLTGNSTGFNAAGPMRGGAIYNVGTLTLTGSTLSGNTAFAISPIRLQRRHRDH
jgi:hypothetical protein